MTSGIPLEGSKRAIWMKYWPKFSVSKTHEVLVWHLSTR
jgi:hypothetical protein